MQRVVLYQLESELYSLNFIEEKSLPTTVICPNPQLADLLSSALSNTAKVQCITISKFITDKLASGFPGISIFRKADFVMHLGTVFKKYFPHSSVEAFFQAFTLFTELRSYTLDLHLISQVFEFFDPQLAKAVEIFWRYCDHVDLVDEHRAYGLLAEAYRTMEHPLHQELHFRPPGENILFWGFNHLSAGQVDLVKAIGIYHDIYIPFPAAVFAHSRMSDWIRWIDPSLSVEAKRSEPQIESIKVCYFPKNRLADTLKKWGQQSTTIADYFLAVSRPDFMQLAEVPIANADYRAQANIFDESYESIVKQLEAKVADDSSPSQLAPWIKEKSRQCIIDKRFLDLKVWQLFADQVTQWFELSDENKELTSFDLSLISHVVQLNLPRIFARPLVQEVDPSRVCGLEGLSNYRKGHPTAVCVTSSYSGLRNGQEKFCPQVMQLLASLGPIRRGDFDYAFLKNQLLRMLDDEQTILFLEHGVNERDLAWAEILESAENIHLVSFPSTHFSRSPDILLRQLERPLALKNRSATSLQSYIDCPRKYYYDYVEKLKIADSACGELSAADLGTIEHKVIELYMKNHRQFDESQLLLLIDQQLANPQLALKDVALLSMAQYQQEIYLCAKNAIVFLLKIYDAHPAAKMYFEFDLPTSRFARGKVDCLVECGNQYIVLDFKRSSGGIPSQKEINDFIKIQLWFYFNHLQLTEEKILLFGYFNLSHPSESLIFQTSVADGELYADLNLLDNGKVLPFKDCLADRLKDYAQFEEQLVATMNSDLHFYSNPRSDSICLYCSVANICPRLNYGAES